jgi:hypothetical protein
VDIERLLVGLERPRGVRSRLASWYGDDRRLVAVSAHGHGDEAMQLLAYGLQGLDARELHLVVPRTAVNPTLARAAFLDATVHVHRGQRAGIGDAEPPMTRTEATTFYRRLGDATPRPDWDSSTWPTWLVELVDWLESRRVERIRTQEAHAWHYRGRQILHVRRSATDGTYAMVAGANYKAPRADQPAPSRLRVPETESPAPEQLAALRQALDLAIDRRRTGADAGHREHLLQAAIGTDPSLVGMTHLKREVPVWRPKQQPRRGRGFLDFLARDVERTGHVIETKIGPDAQLGIQALDYWAWAEAHRPDLANMIDADHERPFELGIVLGRSNKPLLHPAAAATLRRLESTISWRCYLISDWDTIARPRRLLTPQVDPLPARVLPD